MEAKRTALESIVKKQTSGAADRAEDSRSIDGANSVGYHIEHTVIEWTRREVGAQSGLLRINRNCAGFDVGYPQKSPQSVISEVHRGAVRSRKSKKIYGS
jgi:hypothetical protein